MHRVLPTYGQTWSVSISRAGDYLLNTWLRVLVPQIRNAAGVGAGASQQVGWCQNLMHNLVAECCITFNDLVAARFDSLHLDFWAAFTVPQSKQVGYNNMIGNVAALTQPNTYPSFTTAAGLVFTGAAGAQNTIGPNNGIFLNLPLPFFYTRDSGVALPTAALPYNDMRITFTFRPLNTLLTLYSNAGGSVGVPAFPGTQLQGHTTSTIAQFTPAAASQGVNLQTVQVWAEYAIVSNDERKRMACAPRDILIEQVQTAPLQTFNPANNNAPNYDIRFSHAIKVLFFAIVNHTPASLHAAKSCYGTDCPTVGLIAANAVPVVFSSNNNVDPILNTSLIYENTARLATMGSDYYSLVDPYYHGPVIPAIVGLHIYSYSLDFICLDPLGSTQLR